MIVSGIAIAIIALLGWIWLSRGFFPAFLNMICCIAAGAIAFALWEPIAYALLDQFNGNDAMGGTVWGISLAMPFALSMALLRAAVDKCCPANMKFDTVTNAVGGGACGAIAGVITAGIVIISMGFFRVEREFLGYTPVTQQANGSLQYDSSLIVPVDKLTASLYKHASTAAFASSDPLARWYPDLAYVPATNRISFGDGKGRNTINLKDFDVWRRFTVGDKSSRLSDLLVDDWNKTAQTITDIEGSPYPAGTRLEGFVLNFQPSARERSGSVVIGNAQIRLLAEKAGEDPQYLTIHPISVISQAQSEKRAFGRFRFDAPDTFVASVGGASETRMGFEFPIPPGYEPIALYVKNTRVSIPQDKKPVAYATRESRDQAIRKGDMFDQPAEEDLLVPTSRPQVATNPRDQDLGVLISNVLRFIIQRGTERSLRTEEENILEGHEIYEKKLFDSTRGIDRQLQINKFQPKPDTVIVQVEVSIGKPLSWNGKVAIGADSGGIGPQLVDAEGQVYEPVGYIYDEGKYRTIHFNRSQPIRSAMDLPSLSQSRQDQELTLLFDVSKGVKLAKFQVGSTVLHTFKPPMPTDDK